MLGYTPVSEKSAHWYDKSKFDSTKFINIYACTEETEDEVADSFYEESFKQ